MFPHPLYLYNIQHSHPGSRGLRVFVAGANIVEYQIKSDFLAQHWRAKYRPCLLYFSSDGAKLDRLTGCTEWTDMTTPDEMILTTKAVVAYATMKL